MLIDIANVKVVRTSVSMQGLDKPLFTIEDPIPIIDGQITFFDQNLDGFFQIKVKQVKGLGAYYADNMTDLNSEHNEILENWLNRQSGAAKTIEQIRLMVNQKRIKDNKKYMKPGSIQGRVSEMFRRKILYKRTMDSKWYFLNIELAKKCLQTGKFPEIKKHE